MSDGLLPSKASAKFLDYVGLGLILMPIEALGTRGLEGQTISAAQWWTGSIFMVFGAISLILGTWWDKVNIESTGRFATSFDAIVHHAATWLIVAAFIIFGVPIAIGLFAERVPSFPVSPAPPQVPAPPSLQQTSVAPAPEYLKNISIQALENQPDGVLFLDATQAITTDRLRILVDFSQGDPGINPIAPGERIPIGQMTYSVKNMRVHFPIITSAASPSGRAYFWANSLPSRELKGFGQCGYTFYVRLIIIGPSGEEQHYYFSLLGLGKETYLGIPFRVLSEPEDWVSRWEQAK